MTIRHCAEKHCNLITGDELKFYQTWDDWVLDPIMFQKCNLGYCFDFANIWGYNAELVGSMFNDGLYSLFMGQ